MTYTFFINYNSVVTEVFPLNWLECALIDQQGKDQVFYRRNFEGTLTFGGKKRCSDFQLFYDIETVSPCARIDFLIMLDLDIYWEGSFSTSMGEWDLDNQTFTITPLTTDDYTDVLDGADLQYNILSVTPAVTVNVFGGTEVYTRNRWLIDVIEYLADKVAPGCSVASTFFTSFINPATLADNLLLYLTIAQKSDIIRPLSADPATTAMLSWNELMKILWTMFQIRWTYNGVDTITVEHISFFSHSAGVDLRTQDIAQRSNRYKYLKEEMPKYEKFSFMEADAYDFVGVPIWYDSVCVNQDPESNTLESQINVTTDLQHIIDNPDAIADEGFVILCNYLNAGSYYVHTDQGDLTGLVGLNMHLSVANLQNNYFRHNRVLIEGYMNESLETFWSAQKTKIQEINAKICPEHLYEANDFITTELGETYFSGIKGYVKKARIKPYGEVNFSLVYGPADNPNPGITPTKIITLTEVCFQGIQSHFYAVLNQITLIDLHIDIHFTCRETATMATCETATITLDILAGTQNGDCIVPWCVPITESADCVIGYNYTIPAGWELHFIYDDDCFCV